MDRDLTRLTQSDHTRFARQIMLPELGEAGQTRIRNARFLLIGTGGLGSPAALYLAAAGAGTLGLVDDDAVSLSNLQRQILYTSDQIGRPKVECATSRLQALYPKVEVVPYPVRLSETNALDIIRDYDVVIDGSDNFETRYLVNDACVLLNKPNVHASIFRFEGQATVFDGETGPCYRCLYPEPPPATLVPSCSEAGVIGVLPCIMGGIQATEALKLVTGMGEPLAGRLLAYDALTMRFREFSLDKNPDCPICGTQPSITELKPISSACSTGVPGEGPSVPEITAAELARAIRSEDWTVLDVREAFDREAASIEGSVHHPFSDFETGLPRLDKHRSIAVVCKYGLTSKIAAGVLIENGYRSVFSLSGGLMAWARQLENT